MFDKVTITYRGATHEIGRGRDFYGIWAVGGPRSRPLQWWPETAEGWSAAWSKFTSVEPADAIVPVGRRTPPVARNDVPVGAAASAPLAERAAGLGGLGDQGDSAGLAGPGLAGPGTAVLEDRAVPYAPGAPFAQGTPGAQGSPSGPGSPAGGADLRGRSRTGTIAAALLAVGVILGIVGLFPDYLGGSSVASQSSLVVPHAIYLAVWAVSAGLIVLGGARLRLGALLAAGLSLVTFGLFFSDLGTAIVDGAHTGGWGLWLSLAGWVVCAAGSLLALLVRPAGPGPAWSLGRPRGASLGPVIMLVLAGLGAAAAFAPSWDSYILRTATGLTRSITAGYAFDNPGLVIAGNVAVMVALGLVVIVAALWRPVRSGAVLLAGAAIPMVAQAISAVIQIAGGTSPTQFGLTPAQATQLGLTIDSGVTPAFWIYCGFLLALVVSCAWMIFTPHDTVAPYNPAMTYNYNPAAPYNPSGPYPAAAPNPAGPTTVYADDAAAHTWAPTAGAPRAAEEGHVPAPRPAVPADADAEDATARAAADDSDEGGKPVG